MTGNRDARALLPRLTSGGGSNCCYPVKAEEEHGTAENVELSLGLSLNGRFGLEPHRSVAIDNKSKLFRANTVTDLENLPVDVELSLHSDPLTRTCSLPPTTEVDLRKRKELQSFRRSEAKRKLAEKLRNVRTMKKKTCDYRETNLSNLVDGNEMVHGALKKTSSPPSSSPSISPPPAKRLRFPSQGSTGSQESAGSSGISDLDSRSLSGRKGETSVSNERSELNKTKRNAGDKHCAYDERMPCVSTKGCGPDGKRIQGFLYRYGSGEEVRIVCVCHGSFLTPAEFLKHGGCGDVDHPLRHILVTSLFS